METQLKKRAKDMNRPNMKRVTQIVSKAMKT